MGNAMTIDRLFAPVDDSEREAAADAAPADTGADENAGTVVAPVPANVSKPTCYHWQHGEPSAAWTYRDADGWPLRIVCRFDTADGKSFWPITLWQAPDGTVAWRWRSWPPPRPLYGLDALAARPDAPVVVTEGEKSADAAARAFPDYVAVSPPHGAKSPHKADWTPLAGRDVTVWGDADKSGDAFARDVARLVRDAGAADARVVAPPAHADEGWDVADEPPDGVDVRALLDGAEPAPAPDGGDDGDGDDDAGGAPDGDSGDSAVKLPPGFHLARGGLWWTPEEGDDSAKPIKVAGPLEFLAETRAADGTGWGLHLAWRDGDGRRHEWALPRHMLAGDAADVRRVLLDAGLFVAPGQKARNRLSECLTAVRVNRRATAVGRTGWHGNTFVLPDEAVGADGAEPVVFQSEGLPPPFATAGSLADWQASVAALAPGNSRLVFALSAAFAGPLLQLAGAEGGGFHLRGGSSSGKTTILQAAVSVWGGDNFRRTWRATSNGLEAIAAAHNDTLLALDELGEVNGREAGDVAYMLANGMGKARAARSGLARHAHRWRVVFLSTGELSLGDKLAEAGKRPRAGQDVRLVDIAADAGAGMGAFETLHGHADAGALSLALKDAAARYHGTAARAFLRGLVDNRTTVAEQARQARKDFVAAHVPGGADGQVARVADRFGLVAAAGEVATALSVTGWPAGTAEQAAARCFQDWLAARGDGEAAETRQAIEQAQAFIEREGAARFQPMDGDAGRPIPSRAGFVRDGGDGAREWLVFPDVFRREVADGLDAAQAARALAAKGMLRPGGNGRLTRKERLPGLGAKNVYVLRVGADGGGDE